jgi:hypothetical protein
MKSFKEFVKESYLLKYERDNKSDMSVLHVKNTKTGGRTEVRGKSGYETHGYDPKDRLHKLLDKIGKSANFSELMNGQPVSINPKHPKAKLAMKLLKKIDNT